MVIYDLVTMAVCVFIVVYRIFCSFLSCCSLLSYIITNNCDSSVNEMFVLMQLFLMSSEVFIANVTD